MNSFTKLLLLLAINVLASVLVNGQEKQQGPDLKATVEFMNRMVEPEHRVIVLAHQCEIEVHNDWTYNVSLPVKIVETVDEHGIPRREVRWVVIGESYEMEHFSLGDIDPTTSKLEQGFSSDFIKKHHPVQPSDLKYPDMSLVTVHTSDLKNSIEMGGLKDVGNDGMAVFEKAKSTSLLLIVFESQDRAGRFVTALTHAANLCGAKPSDFPPAPISSNSEKK